jgi:hypothetical protein
LTIRRVNREKKTESTYQQLRKLKETYDIDLAEEFVNNQREIDTDIKIMKGASSGSQVFNLQERNANQKANMSQVGNMSNKDYMSQVQSEYMS